MALTDLKKTAGLSLAFDGSDLIAQEKDIDIAQKQTATIDDMRSQILNPTLSCPTIFYYKFPEIDRKSVLKDKNLRFDMYAIPSNLAGIEYVKTAGQSADEYPVLIESAYGYLTVILQSNPVIVDAVPKVKSTVVKIKKGEKLVIPPNHDFVLVNARQSLTMVSMIYSRKTKVRRVFDDRRGISRYVIRKNARLEVVKNPSYRNVESVKSWDPMEYYDDFKLTEKTPIFKQILRKYKRFKWLHEPSKIDWTKLPGCY
jgi:oxalate decarboxylase/phosphoglucose isomerase-like protein (cupin superfamily)